MDPKLSARGITQKMKASEKPRDSFDALGQCVPRGA
jgi:hypothetical protein